MKRWGKCKEIKGKQMRERGKVKETGRKRERGDWKGKRGKKRKREILYGATASDHELEGETGGCVLRSQREQLQLSWL